MSSSNYSENIPGEYSSLITRQLTKNQNKNNEQVFSFEYWTKKSASLYNFFMSCKSQRIAASGKQNYPFCSIRDRVDSLDQRSLDLGRWQRCCIAVRRRKIRHGDAIRGFS